MKNINKRYRYLLKQKYFKRRIKRILNEQNGRYYVNYGNIPCEEKTIKQNGWNEILFSKVFRWYRTTSTPCSCWMCGGERYNRAKEKIKINKLIKNY